VLFKNFSLSLLSLIDVCLQVQQPVALLYGNIPPLIAPRNYREGRKRILQKEIEHAAI